MSEGLCTCPCHSDGTGFCEGCECDFVAGFYKQQLDAANQRIKTLEIALANERRAYENTVIERDAEDRNAEAAERKLAGALEALHRYGQHFLDRCVSVGPCECGFTQTIAEIEQAQPDPGDANKRIEELESDNATLRGLLAKLFLDDGTSALDAYVAQAVSRAKEAAERKLADARTALEFYKNPGRWIRTYSGIGPMDRLLGDKDGFEVAHRALAQIEQPQDAAGMGQSDQQAAYEAAWPPEHTPRQEARTGIIDFTPSRLQGLSNLIFDKSHGRLTLQGADRLAEEVAHWVQLAQNEKSQIEPQYIERSDKKAAQRDIDVANLRFYAEMFKQHEWSTVVIHWGVFEQTLREIADRIEQSQDVDVDLTGTADDLIADTVVDAIAKQIDPAADRTAIEGTK